MSRFNGQNQRSTRRMEGQSEYQRNHQENYNAPSQRYRSISRQHWHQQNAQRNYHSVSNQWAPRMEQQHRHQQGAQWNHNIPNQWAPRMEQHWHQQGAQWNHNIPNQWAPRMESYAHQDFRPIQGTGENRGQKRRGENLDPNAKRSKFSGNDSNNCSSSIGPAELLQRLAAAGMLSSPSPPITPPATPIAPSEKRKNILDDLCSMVDNLTVDQSKKNQTILGKLYGGQQCSNCDRRFNNSQSTEYKEHLDCHFAQNRQHKTSKNFARRAPFIAFENWCAKETVPEKDEAVIVDNFLEDLIKEQKAKKAPKPKQPSLKDTGIQHCYLCLEKFEEFFNQEEEEWQIRPAVHHKGKIVHPGCI